MRGADDTETGYLAVYLFRHRYPEIPSFVYHSGWEPCSPQRVLTRGAEWCFQMGSPVRNPPGNPQQRPADTDELSCFALEERLRLSATARHGAYSQPPYPGQLRLDITDSASRRLADKLGLALPIGKCERGRELQRIMARVFPNADQVQPVRVLSSGRSGAEATFFVRSASYGIEYATRFMKVGNWPLIQKEYLAYQTVIRPRLNSHVAHIVGEPVCAESTEAMTSGAVLYSLAGFPEAYSSLHSLHELLSLHLGSVDGAKVAAYLRQTLEQVLKPLYRPGEAAKIRKRPLWHWLSEVLPPVHTGVLVPLETFALAPQSSQPYLVRSYTELGYKAQTAWILAARDLVQAPTVAGASPYRASSLDTAVRLQGARLLEIHWTPGQSGELVLAHPDLGCRIRLRAAPEEIRRRFGALWIRPDLSVDVWAWLDTESLEYSEKFAARPVG